MLNGAAAPSPPAFSIDAPPKRRHLFREQPRFRAASAARRRRPIESRPPVGSLFGILFRGPILRVVHTRPQIVRQIREAVIHQLGHYFGLARRRTG
ncbi:MAG TPA: metallopeptidase family protein [Thermoanaerobaculia bacterium]